MAWEKDFKKSSLGGQDYLIIDNVDFAYFSGHGRPTGFYFNNDHDDRKLSGTKNYKEAEWGNTKLKWIVIDACRVLQENDDDGRWSERWGWSVFKGLHQILGFETSAHDVSDRGNKFADYMIENEYTIKNAWFKACDDTETDVRASVIFICDSGSTNTANDHLPGHGSFATTTQNPTCLGMVVHNC